MLHTSPLVVIISQDIFTYAFFPQAWPAQQAANTSTEPPSDGVSKRKCPVEGSPSPEDEAHVHVVSDHDQRDLANLLHSGVAALEDTPE